MHTCQASLALATLSFLGGAPQSAPPSPEPAVRVELVTDRVQIAPRETFEVAVRLTIPDGHTLGWQNPGDAGRPTTATLTAPPGFRVEGPLYPAPRRLDLGGGAVGYGYEKEALLVFRVTPPADLARAQRAQLAASVDWLARGAKETPGHARVETSVAVYPARDASASDATGALERARPLLPQPWRTLERASVGWRTLWTDTGEGAGVALEIEVEGAARLEFFPLASERFDYAGQKASARRGGAAIQIEGVLLTSGAYAMPEARGVLVVERDGARTAHAVHEVGRL
jgi:DsbC/DsbD-like thiol-disulfide interchange protein